MKLTSTLAIILLGAIVSGSALAGSHLRFGVFIGAPVFAPFYYPYYYPYPYYYYPPVVTVPYSPPTYIEQGGGQSPAQSQGYWYYCTDANAYYPYVKVCPGGWQRVAPQPPPGS